MQSDFLTAMPNSGSPNRLLLREALVRRTIYPFADGEDPSTWKANVGGAVPLAIANSSGGLFFVDLLDFSTPPDGVTVIRSQDNYCYKISNMTIPDSVLGIDVDAPDGTEDIGAAYITSSAPTDEFAYNPDQIAVLTIRGWLFIEPREGRPIYVRGDRHYYRNEDGLWLPTWAPAYGGVRDADIVGGIPYRPVENSTTNTPPVSPAAGKYWRVGGTPTGAWVGHVDELATFYSGDTDWTFILPTEGMLIYDKAVDATYVYDGTNWIAQRGAIVESNLGTMAIPPTTTSGGAGNYIMSVTTAPRTDTNVWRRDDTTAITKASKSGRKLRFNWHMVANSNVINCIMLLRDSEVNAIAWSGHISFSASYEYNGKFEIDVTDNLSHVYRWAAVQLNGQPVMVAPLRSRFGYEEIL